MVGMDGLAPLIGLIDPARNLVARSDQVSETQFVPAPANGRAELEYRAEVHG